MKTIPKYSVLVALSALLIAAVGTTLDDFFLPGSQPGQSGNIEHPGKCDNCHGGYDNAVEPAFNWRGSMMSQSMRDPLYLAALAIANQDAVDSGDLCIRCHAPDGWLNGRSIPTDGSALNANDREGVQCDFCHKLVKPTSIGINPFPDDPDYTATTFDDDQAYLAQLSEIPPQSGNGMYIVDSDNAKRGPFVNAAAKHQMEYSPFHSESELCATCHDVSNPAFKTNRDVFDAFGNFTYDPNIGATNKSFNTYDMFPVERTYSEWKESAFNSSFGISAADFTDIELAELPFGGNKSSVSTCQDCHMRDVTGYGCNKKGAPLRDDLPLHDMTGGNTFMPGLVAQLFPDEVDHGALAAGVERARYMLQNAAHMEVTLDEAANKANVKITNLTGHKLPSGYPEGRRMWINYKVSDNLDNVLYESGAYDENTAVLDKTNNTKIYEAKLGMTQEVANAANNGPNSPAEYTYTEGESFHFVLNNMVMKDNRIPPMGFNNEKFREIQSPPVDYTYDDGQYWDITEFPIPSETYKIEVKLFYQTTSKEYVEFLRDRNVTNNAGQVMYDLWATNGKSAPELMLEETVYIGTPPEPTEKSVTVQSVDLVETYVSSKGGRYYLDATVTVSDHNNELVPGALVSAQISGPLNRSVSGITDLNGQVVFEASSKKSNTDWCLEVTNIERDEHDFIATPMVCESDLNNVTAANSEKMAIYPNPTSESTTIGVDLTESQNLLIEAYDLSGIKVRTIADGYFKSGKSEIKLNTNALPPGIYVIKMNSNKSEISKLLVVN